MANVVTLEPIVRSTPVLTGDRTKPVVGEHNGGDDNETQEEQPSD